jgi:hypothetical protein
MNLENPLGPQGPDTSTVLTGVSSVDNRVEGAYGFLPLESGSGGRCVRQVLQTCQDEGVSRLAGHVYCSVEVTRFLSYQDDPYLAILLRKDAADTHWPPSGLCRS